MIGSFWNLCRACPSMPVDKLHSEYRSTYRWHEYTGPRQEVVRRPPLASSGGNTSKLQHTKSADDETADGGIAGTQSEPALPRRKKHPELAYKTHEFLAMADAGGSDDSLDATVPLDRARSEERGGSRPRPSRRSKSEGPPTGSSSCCPGPGFGTGSGPVQSEYRLQYMRVDSPPPQGRTVRSDSDPCEGVIDQEMGEKVDEAKKEMPRPRKEYLIRHHLERTTGANDGALLPSPTREKLEPVLPRPRDEDLPKSPQKASPKSSPRTARSQSVGPGLSGENRSPKRQSRAPSAAPVAAVHKGQVNGPAQVERRPRPSMDEEKHDEEQEDGMKPCSEVEDSKDECEPEIEPALVKSPPEPTRVKSPEQIIIRSPEPVNWTVPLDTGKTFTVTQNVREGELINRPHSEVKAWTPPAAPPPAPQSAPPELPEQMQPSSGWRSPLSDSEQIVASTSGSEASGVTPVIDDKKEPVEAKASSATATSQFETPVKGTTFKCLDDPSFAFESGSTERRDLVTKPGPQEPDGQFSQVGSKLLDRGEGEQVVKCQTPERTLSKVEKSGMDPSRASSEETGGRASEEMTSLSDVCGPSEVSGIESQTKALPVVSPSSGRSLASDVLEKARTRFDKFWGKGKESPEKEGKV